MKAVSRTRREFLKDAGLFAGAATILHGSPSFASTGGKMGGTIEVALNETIDTFDPFTTNATIVRTMHSHIFESLYSIRNFGMGQHLYVFLPKIMLLD